jgi:uncharacterized protein (TIGR02271 family)
MTDNVVRSGTIPLAEERIAVTKRVTETGKVRIRTVVDHEHVLVSEQLSRENIVVERIEINQDVAAAPQVRQEGDLLIIPVVEEYVFTEKRLRLKEELHVRTVRSVEHLAETVPVRRMRAVVEREDLGGGVSPTGDPQ